MPVHEFSRCHLPTGMEYFHCLSLRLSILINRFEMLMQPWGADADERPAEKTLHWMSLCISDSSPLSFFFYSNHAQKPQWYLFQVKEEKGKTHWTFFFILFVVKAQPCGPADPLLWLFILHICICPLNKMEGKNYICKCKVLRINKEVWCQVPSNIRTIFYKSLNIS